VDVKPAAVDSAGGSIIVFDADMPGITGIIGPGAPDERRDDLLRMVRSLTHEDFFNSGTYAGGKLGVWVGWAAHRGSFADGMPVWNERRDVGLVFSGEDFTDSEDIRRLRGRGHDFGTGGAEYLVHMYEDDGPAFVERLNGRFSGLVMDLRDDRALLFNDRHGLNRIYFFEDKGVLYFSSEAKALLRVRPGLRRIDPRSLGELLACGCVLQNRTLFTGLSLLPGGSVWTFGPGEQPRRDTYFRPDAWEGQGRMSGAAYYDELKRTWARILPRYLAGKEPVGVSLTGGKDSRMIMAWVRHSPGTMPCYTFGGPIRDCQDVKLARRVAAICGQSHRVIFIDRPFFEEFPRLAERAVYLTDGTMDVSGAPELYVNRLARQIAPVRLTGNYGQEILRSYVAFRPRPTFARLLRPEFRGFLEAAAGTYREESAAHPQSFVAFKQVPWFHYSRLSLELSQVAIRSPFLDKEVVALAYRAPAGAEENARIQMRLIAEGNPALAALPTDRGARLRPIPFVTALGRQFQQFTFKAEFAYDYGMPQWLARVDGALRPLRLERLFLGRHKFVHLRVWYRDELSGYVKDILLDPRTLARPYFDREYIEAIVRAHIKGQANHALEINQALTCELIHRQFIDA
jgi:asparagine synthase (glutamine-hydrolysing)